MERTRFFRRPVVWIILVIIGVIALSSFFTSGPSYQRVDTSVALARLQQPGIKKVLEKDKEQTLQIDLENPEKIDGKTTDKIETQFPYQVTSEVWSCDVSVGSSMAVDCGRTCVVRGAMARGLK